MAYDLSMFSFDSVKWNTPIQVTPLIKVPIRIVDLPSMI
jgi:hypothetical protein